VKSDGYNGPWGPCFTGVFGAAWREENCPGFVDAATAGAVRDRATTPSGGLENSGELASAARSLQSAPEVTDQEQIAAWARSIEPLPAGGWKLLGPASTDNKSVLFASTHNLNREGSIVSVWFRFEFMLPQHNDESNGNFQSFVERDEIDCTAQASKRLAISYYQGNNLDNTGPAYVWDAAKLLWAPAVPGTIFEAMAGWACENSASHSAIPKPKRPS